jgi:hypothetical protein
LIGTTILSAHFERSLYGEFGSNFTLQVRASAGDLGPLDNFGAPGSFALSHGSHLSEQLRRILYTLGTGKHGRK